MPKQDSNRPNSRKFSSVETDGAGIFEVICIFICGMGVSIGFTATLSCVSYLTAIFNDKDIFLYLCCCVYGPTLPVVLFQLNCDPILDRRWGSTRTYFVRVIFAYLCGISSTLYLPFGSGLDPAFEGKRSYVALLLPVTIMGIQVSVLHGMFFQLVSFIRFRKKGVGAAAFTFGYQGSGFASLAITYVCGGFGADPTLMQIDTFFNLVAVVQVVAMSSFTWMALKSEPYKEAIARRDEEMKWLSFKNRTDVKRTRGPESVQRLFNNGMSLVSSSLVNDYDRRYLVPLEEMYRADAVDTSNSERKQSVVSLYWNSSKNEINATEKNSDRERDAFKSILEIVDNMEPASKTFVLGKIWPCAAGLFLVIFGSIFLMPFYSYFPGGSTLPQILFYTKLFSDTLSRPLTMIIPRPRSRWLFLVMTFFRLLLFLPFFFLYIYDVMRIRNDVLIIAMVSLYSITSGLFATFGWQLAPTLLEHVNSKLIAANQMNLSFNSACVMSLITSSIIIKTVDLGRLHNVQ